MIVSTFDALWADGPVLEIGSTIRMGRTVIVSPVGTDIQNGEALLDAMNSIAADSNIQYLLKIEPGVYDVGSNVLVLKKYVDIEGSGELRTKIVGSNATQGVISGDRDTEIRFLSVENRGGGDKATALFYLNSGYPSKITHVQAFATGSPYNYGLWTENSSIVIRNSRIHASFTNGAGACWGIYNRGGACDIYESEVRAHATDYNAYGVHNTNDGYMNIYSSFIAGDGHGATGWSYGVYNDNKAKTYMKYSNVSGSGGGGSWGILNTNTGYRTEFEHGDVSGGSNSVRNDNASGLVNVGSSKIQGWVQGVVKCVCLYHDIIYSFYDNTCPAAP
jgi:hypothetical protein